MGGKYREEDIVVIEGRWILWYDESGGYGQILKGKT